MFALAAGIGAFSTQRSEAGSYSSLTLTQFWAIKPPIAKILPFAAATPNSRLGVGIGILIAQESDAAIAGSTMLMQKANTKAKATRFFKYLTSHSNI
jgi:hypothetical protein